MQIFYEKVDEFIWLYSSAFMIHNSGTRFYFASERQDDMGKWVAHHIRDVRFAYKVDQIGPKWDTSGNFSDHISVHFGSAS